MTEDPCPTCGHSLIVFHGVNEEDVQEGRKIPPCFYREPLLTKYERMEIAPGRFIRQTVKPIITCNCMGDYRSDS